MLSDQKPPVSKTGKPCSVAVLLETLPKAESEAFAAMLGSRQWTEAAVWEACTAEGYSVGQQTIGKHRNGRCRCAKK